MGSRAGAAALSNTRRKLEREVRRERAARTDARHFSLSVAVP
jgi:hypothetical protein